MTITESLNHLSSLAVKRGDMAAAEAMSRRSLKIREDHFGPDHPMVASGLAGLAAVLKTAGAYDAAEPLFARSLSIRETQCGPDHPSVAMSVNNLALMLQEKGKAAYSASEPLFKRAMAVTERHLGPKHCNMGVILGNLARVYEATGRVELAGPLVTRVVAIQEATADDRPTVASTLTDAPAILSGSEREETLEASYERLLLSHEREFGQHHPGAATMLNNLGLALACDGEAAYGRAEPLYRRALSICEKHPQLGPDHLDTAMALNNLALFLVEEGKKRAAMPLFTRSHGIREKRLGADSVVVAHSLNNLAELSDPRDAALLGATRGCFKCTSTLEWLSDRKGVKKDASTLRETLKRDDHSSERQLKRVETDRDL